MALWNATGLCIFVSKQLHRRCILHQWELLLLTAVEGRVLVVLEDGLLKLGDVLLSGRAWKLCWQVWSQLPLGTPTVVRLVWVHQLALVEAVDIV